MNFNANGCQGTMGYALLQYIRHRKVFFAHDEKEEGNEGDIVIIKSCYPISKKKHFVIEEFVERAPRCTSEQTHKPQPSVQMDELSSVLS